MTTCGFSMSNVSNKDSMSLYQNIRLLDETRLGSQIDETRVIKRADQIFMLLFSIIFVR